MSALHRTLWTQEQFFSWAASQEARYEFDGHEPVAMTGGTINHGLIAQNLYMALHSRLRGTGCRSMGPDVGLTTIRGAVRFPDAFVTCSKLVGNALTADGAVIVFEVVSATSGRTDRIIKVREYAAIRTVRRYVILESTSADLTVLDRPGEDDPWRAATLVGGDEVLRMPEIGTEIPVAEFYEDVDLEGAV